MTGNKYEMPDAIWVSDSIATNKLGIQVCSIKPNKTFPRPQTQYIRADLASTNRLNTPIPESRKAALEMLEKWMGIGPQTPNFEEEDNDHYALKILEQHAETFCRALTHPAPKDTLSVMDGPITYHMYKRPEEMKAGDRCPVCRGSLFLPEPPYGDFLRCNTCEFAPRDVMETPKDTLGTLPADWHISWLGQDDGAWTCQITRHGDLEHLPENEITFVSTRGYTAADAIRAALQKAGE